ncbi:hypothetical protein Clacol_006317 [Clathrus columnatus]|uniref:Voltage-gated hydrogen channel 1 n=1 Tax=Clathrus columnatus TaxID=1419009 RepID=A0AAV5ABQ8_9AGAM|nr:hypothetical protein Clacol_006317 [Clathrus columnatus]
MSTFNERDPLISSDDVERGEEEEGGSKTKGLRKRVTEKLESKHFRRAIIALIVIDSVLILIDLAYTYLGKNCGHVEEAPAWVEILANVSLGIACAFMLEFLTFAWAFGPTYYSPFSSVLHFIDGFIIVGTFLLEVALKGQERELASLLILFRLIRFAAEAAVGMGELDEEKVEELEHVKAQLAKRTAELTAAREEISRLKLRADERAEIEFDG